MQELNQYKPLVTYDNYEEIKKIKKHAPLAGLALRIKVPNTGAMVNSPPSSAPPRAKPWTSSSPPTRRAWWSRA